MSLLAGGAVRLPLSDPALHHTAVPARFPDFEAITDAVDDADSFAFFATDPNVGVQIWLNPQVLHGCADAIRGCGKGDRIEADRQRPAIVAAILGRFGVPMARIKNNYRIPSFVSPPVLSVEAINNLRARVCTSAAMLPIPVRAVGAGHLEHLERLALINELLQNPGTAAALGVPCHYTDELRAHSTSFMRLAGAAMGLTRWAEDARDLAAGVQIQNHSQLATEVATLIGNTELPLRERHRIEDLWTPVRSAQLAARSAQLQEERNHHEIC